MLFIHLNPNTSLRLFEMEKYIPELFKWLYFNILLYTFSSVCCKALALDATRVHPGLFGMQGCAAPGIFKIDRLAAQSVCLRLPISTENYQKLLMCEALMDLGLTKSLLIDTTKIQNPVSKGIDRYRFGFTRYRFWAGSK